MNASSQVPSRASRPRRRSSPVRMVIAYRAGDKLHISLSSQRSENTRATRRQPRRTRPVRHSPSHTVVFINTRTDACTPSPSPATSSAPTAPQGSGAAPSRRSSGACTARRRPRPASRAQERARRRAVPHEPRTAAHAPRGLATLRCLARAARTERTRLGAPAAERRGQPPRGRRGARGRRARAEPVHGAQGALRGAPSHTLLHAARTLRPARGRAGCTGTRRCGARCAASCAADQGRCSRGSCRPCCGTRRMRGCLCLCVRGSRSARVRLWCLYEAA